MSTTPQPPVPRMRRARTTAFAALLVTALAGCALGSASTPAALPASAGDVAAQLASLRVAAPGTMSGYSRDKFGHGWISQGHSCDTREIVLQQQGRDVTSDPKTCRITGGTWVSVYDGVTVHSATQLDIDHLVPEAESWRTGAASWTSSQRQTFANDYSDGELVAVTAHSNRSKGDQPPPDYLPAQSQWCHYATGWIKVKATWHLTVTQSEHDALVRMLGTCH